MRISHDPVLENQRSPNAQSPFIETKHPSGIKIVSKILSRRILILTNNIFIDVFQQLFFKSSFGFLFTTIFSNAQKNHTTLTSFPFPIQAFYSQIFPTTSALKFEPYVTEIDSSLIAGPCFFLETSEWSSETQMLKFLRMKVSQLLFKLSSWNLMTQRFREVDPNLTNINNSFLEFFCWIFC